MMSSFDAVSLEVFRRQLDGIAEEMGRTLIRSAYSPNIKERRDASSALFDPDGRLIAQAEHIPVHLGAMPDAVEAVIDAQSDPEATYLVNDPYHGGSHLPDVTVVGAIFVADTHVGYGAIRAHWADIGGPTPGGLAGGARTIFEEGMRVPPTPIADGDQLREAPIELLLSNVRNPRQRRADLMAQLGALRVGNRRLESVVETHGIDRLLAAYDAVIDYSARRTTDAIEAIQNGTYHGIDYLEGDGFSNEPIPIELTVTVEDDKIEVDFDGTADQVPGNLNAPPAVAKSAVYFMLRCITDPDIPSNHGCYQSVDISIPAGSLLDPNPPAAVGGGNVETSQRIVDVLLDALRQAVSSLPAHGQGTMNNLIIGFDGEHTYYETIGGGAGATETADGTDGVHVGMTNTRNTPIEALERAYPVLVERYGLRTGSGGRGRHRGGTGIERTMRVEAPATVSILSERRRLGPPGVAGGKPGRVGENRIDGDPVGSKVTVRVEAGTQISILTPGGGGYGAPSPE